MMPQCGWARKRQFQEREIRLIFLKGGRRHHLGSDEIEFSGTRAKRLDGGA